MRVAEVAAILEWGRGTAIRVNVELSNHTPEWSSPDLKVVT